MGQPRQIRVVVADDFPAMRRGVLSVLESGNDVKVVGEAGSAAEVLAAVRKNRPHVLMLDLGMPGAHGTELIRRLCTDFPKLAIVVFSMHREDDVAVACLRAGAAAFVNKASSTDEVLCAVRAVAAGGRYLSPHLTEQLLAEAKLPDETPHNQLTDRELFVLCAIAEGRRLSEIAADLGVSTKTVGTFRQRVLAKLDLQSNADVVLYAVDHHLLGWPPYDKRKKVGSGKRA